MDIDMNYDPSTKDDLDYMTEMFKKLMEKTVLTPEFMDKLDQKAKEWRRERLNRLKKRLGIQDKKQETIKKELETKQNPKKRLDTLNKKLDPDAIQKEYDQDKKKKQRETVEKDSAKQATTKSASDIANMTPKQRSEYFKNAPPGERMTMLKKLNEAVKNGSITRTPGQTMNPQKAQQAKQAQSQGKSPAAKAPVRGGGRAR